MGIHDPISMNFSTHIVKNMLSSTHAKAGVRRHFHRSASPLHSPRHDFCCMKHACFALASSVVGCLDFSGNLRGLQGISKEKLDAIWLSHVNPSTAKDLVS